jgi:DNA-binding GntR family transcriptional regulator
MAITHNLSSHDSLAASDEETASSVASERVTDAIRNAILEARFAPGSRIRQEDLAEQFGTSRLPVRLALKRLESEGLVTLVANSGAWVAKLDLKECVEVYKIRERLEPLALAEAARQIPESAILDMELLADRMEALVEIEEFILLDRQFHLLSYTACGMPRLERMIERFWNSTQHYRRAFSSIVGLSRATLAHYEHRLLIAALRRRDGEEAERILYGHIRRTRLELEQHPEIFEAGPKARSRRPAR